MKYLFYSVLIFSFFVPTLCLTGKFWQITDQHYDWLYKYKSEPFLGFCRVGEGDAGYFGDYNCDIPWRTVESAIEEMARVEPNVDFVINSGDSFPHALGTAEDKLQTIENVTNAIRKYFPNTPIFYSPGNHDFEPTHCCSPGPNTWLQKMSHAVFEILNPEQKKTFLQGGYYSQVISGLRVVIMNTVLYYHDNRNTTDSTGDISGQYAWISSELDQASANREKVLIVGHVPPGYAERFGDLNFHEQFNAPFVNLFEEHPHKDLIIAQLYGHLHSDSFRLSNDAGALLLAPSVTGWKNYYSESSIPNNPAMGRLFYYDTVNKDLVKYEQYYTDLQTSNENLKLKWHLEYDTSMEPFNMQDLSLLSFQNFFYEMKNNDDIFDQYYLYNLVNYKTDPCDADCKNMQLCALEYLYEDKYTACRNSKK
ncbi:sphingomyelin phosphodiesterase [Anaeramoeba flamelloides]|uniref:Sphingomyelin phosphodiesterase n=1 Tax=Anaeramoeba flamelloides TaxID=1746091 RepID=A0ABQ8Y8W3_9EUKA|nr:sphingomyelin phosphodiesterase [Anaeramoeba flamelloides]